MILGADPGSRRSLSICTYMYIRSIYTIVTSHPEQEPTAPAQAVRFTGQDGTPGAVDESLQLFPFATYTYCFLLPAPARIPRLECIAPARRYSVPSYVGPGGACTILQLFCQHLS